MLEVAKRKKAPNLIAADGLKLPFAAGSFDAVTIAFGFRNMASWPDALVEISRVLRPGGSLLILDFSMPSGLFGEAYQLYLHHFLPRLARVVTGEQSAYEYLGDSIERFPQGAIMEEILVAAKFGAMKQLTPYRRSGGHLPRRNARCGRRGQLRVYHAPLLIGPSSTTTPHARRAAPTKAWA